MADPAIVDPYATKIEEKFTAADWKETAASWRTGAESVFNKKSGEAMLTGLVESKRLEAALRLLVGYEQTFFQGDNNYYLCRQPPVRHPRYRNLWCTAVGESEFKPETAGRGATLKVPSKSVPFRQAPPLPHRTGYRMAKVWARFGPLPYKVMTDEDGSVSLRREEWLRYTSVEINPEPSTLELKYQYKFAEGSGFPILPPHAYSNPAGNDCLAEHATVLFKVDYAMTWHSVPAKWLMDGLTGLRPQLVLNRLGCVNSDAFMNFPAGTLLLLGAKLQRDQWTLMPRDELVINDVESEFLYDVTLMFSYFNPPKGSNFVLGAPEVIATNLGHNNFPYRGRVAAAAPTDPQASKWFLATLNGRPDGATLYRTAEFARLFNSPLNFVNNDVLPET